MGAVLVVDRVTKAPVAEKLWVLFRTSMGRLLLSTPFMREYLVRSSQALGPQCDTPESCAEIPRFVAAYGVDLSEVALPIEKFRSLNEFFYRELASGARPVFEASNSAAAVQPADCRLVVFPAAADAARVWIKGETFTMRRFLEPYLALPGMGSDALEPFLNGSVAISRLAPTDYHRFHAPVGGRVLSVSEAGSDLLTVKPVAVRGKVDVFGRNKRFCVAIDSPDFGTVLYVLVGATYVGSVVFSVKVGQTVAKGDEVGYFAYGGSCAVTVFGAGVIDFDADLVERSGRGVETLVKHSTSLGRARASKHHYKTNAAGQRYYCGSEL